MRALRRVRPPSPYLALAIGVLAASTASLFIRYTQQEGVPSLTIAAIRLSLAALLLTPVALQGYRGELRRLSLAGYSLALASGCFLAIHFASWITSLEHTSVLISVVLVSTSPLWVALLAPLLIREAFDRRILFGIIIAFAGGMLITLAEDNSASGPQPAPLVGSVLALTGAIAVALYLITGRRLRANLSVVAYIWLVYGTAAIVLLLAVALTGGSLADYSPTAYFWMLMLAVIPQLIGHSSFNYALGHLPAAYVSLVSLAEPAGSSVLAFIFLGEAPAVLQVVGAGLILLGVFVAQQTTARSANPPIPPDIPVE
ncbi:MAG: DMT family transporter [Anaerolineae bacterium]|nr:DMT family transporter [Anaerolineae bacterium]